MKGIQNLVYNEINDRLCHLISLPYNEMCTNINNVDMLVRMRKGANKYSFTEQSELCGELLSNIIDYDDSNVTDYIDNVIFSH